MATNLHIPETLMERALKLGGRKTKRETVIEALEEYVQKRGQLKILELRGKIDFDPEYDYKKERHRK